MANTTVGSLNVMVGANIRGLNRGLRRGAQSIGGFASRVSQVGRTMVKFGAIAVGAGAAIGGVMVKRQMAAIDQTAKLSQQLGISTEHLAGLRHAAEITGVSAGQLDSGMQSLAKRLGEAAQKGSGPAADAMEALGLSVDDVMAMNPSEQFRTISDAIAGIENPTQRAAIASQLFSKRNMGLVNTLALGRDGLDEMQREAEALGLAFSQQDAAKVEAANDAITRLRSAITGAARSLTVAIAPAITRTMDFFTRLVVSAKQMGSGLMQTFRPVFMTIKNVVVSAWQSTVQSTVRFGAAVFGVIRSAFGAVWSVISSVLPASAQTAGGTFEMIVGFVNKMRDAVTFAFNVVEFSIKNWRAVLELAGAKAALSIVQFGSQVKHFFTGVIPSLLDWFADNWKEVFITVGANTLTFFENLTSNIVSTFKNLPALISGSMSFGEIWKPLSDGFVNVIRELPEIPERQKGALEQALQTNVNALEQSVGRDLDSFLAQKRKQADDAANMIAGLFRPGNGLFEGSDAPQIDTEAIGGDIAEGFNAKADAGGGSLELIRAGSAQAQAFAQQMSQRRQSDNLDRQTAAATKKTAENTGVIARNMGRQSQPVTVNIAG